MQIGSSAATQGNLVNAAYLSFTSGVGHYNLVVFGEAPLTTNVDLLRMEVVYPNDVGPTPPVTQNFTTAGYRSCLLCSIYAQNCDQSANCEKTYLAQGGSVTVTRADKNELAGHFAGSMSGVLYKEWNLNTDTAVPGGSCIQLGTVGPFDVYWSADGGVPP
ncbi:MAG: hypothetical protein U0228_27755 [Myxococcaceae bacterium]